MRLDHIPLGGLGKSLGVSGSYHTGVSVGCWICGLRDGKSLLPLEKHLCSLNLMHTRVGGWELVRDQSVNQALKQWLWEGGVSQWFLLSSFLSCTPTIIPVFSYQSPFLSLSFLLPFFLFFLTSSQSFLYICFLEFPFPHHSCTSDPCFRPLTTFHLTVRGKQTSRDKFMAS